MVWDLMSEALAELALRAERRKMQDELRLLLHKGNIDSMFFINFFLNGRFTGYANLLRRPGKLVEWESFYPKSEYSVKESDGYGTLCHRATIRLIAQYLEDDWEIGHRIEPFRISSPRVAQLKSMGINLFGAMKIYDYLKQGEEYARGKFFIFSDTSMFLDYEDDAIMEYSFPSPLNALNCTGCLGISCPLSNAMTERHLSEGLDRRAPQEQYSDRQVGGDPLHRQIMYRDRDTGLVSAQCIRIHPDASEEVLGIYPLPNAR